VIEDLPSAVAGGFGAPGHVWFGNTRGLKRYEDEALEADVRVQVTRLLDAFRKQSTLTFALRAADLRDAPTREEFEAAAAVKRELDRNGLKLQDLSQAAQDLAGRLGPASTDRPLGLAEVLGPSPPASVTTSAPGPANGQTLGPAGLGAPPPR
jgi:hypothetical protein